MTWVLILVVFVGGASIATVPGFGTLANCQQAGRQSENLIRGNVDAQLAWVCVSQEEPEMPEDDEGAVEEV
jgi:UPF0716 family protein affecting phage T7 exclusion